MRHVLEPDQLTLHGHFSRELAPVLTIDSGDTVVFTTLDAGWGLEPWQPGPYQPREVWPGAESGHALVGPVAIRGAEPGMTLQVDIGEIVPVAHGACLAGGWESAYNEQLRVIGDGIIHAYTFSDGVGVNQFGHSVALRPFMGVMGMPPDEPGEHSTVPPRRTGGNLDCKELVSGTTLFLPIEVEGALFSAGDGHARQSDGEVSGTAIECPMERVVLTFRVRDDMPLKTPRALTPEGWLVMGFDADLNKAAEQALDGALDLMVETLSVERAEAMALASLIVDLRVTQIVNQVKGVHAIMRGLA
jgi:acetamidase/formamidase